MLKKNEPDWIEHDGSSECPVPAGHDVEVEHNWGKTYRCDNPELRDWTRVTHYRDWTAFEQQQTSAEVPKLLTEAEWRRVLIGHQFDLHEAMLREQYGNLRPGVSQYPLEAADLIETQAREIERLREALTAVYNEGDFASVRIATLALGAAYD